MTYRVKFDPQFVPLPIHQGLDMPGVAQLLMWRKTWIDRYGKDFTEKVDNPLFQQYNECVVKSKDFKHWAASPKAGKVITMHKSNFVASLKVGGKILRENSGVVTLPFGAEYDILLKNLNSRRAMAKVTVDGQDATEGTKLILEPNSTLVLERFIKNGNLNSGNRFKFIERTEQIEKHRGIKEDDGLVRVEFWTEKEVVDVPVVRKHYYDQYYPRPKPWYPRPWTDPYYPTYPPIWCSNTSSGGLMRSAISQGATGSLSPSPVRAMSANMFSESSFDAGITVPGSESRQQFRNVSGFDTESNSHVIVLQLRGKVGESVVSKPITVDQKPICPTCGAKNKYNDKFCRECGTSLVIFS